ncbi:hypothetical protein BZM27_27060 [Paraburkholderia steynii]|uniref:Uncharacterized protein n=1 Tax=Paraburkholderia steynii TaxID=1245441 RepID=A0A4R0XH20_9BURK|nr:hypothetical protein BZM27_27060 [Paraburkholderia steynii]
MPGEANNYAKPAGALKDRFCQSGPFDGCGRANIALAGPVREGSEGSQKITIRYGRESASTTYRQIWLHGFR